MKLSPTLQQLADLAEIRGDVSEGRSLRQMALAVASLPDDSDKVVQRLPHVPGLDRRSEEQLRDLIRQGVGATLARALDALPADLRRLAQVPGVGLDGVARVHQHLGITTAGELSAALDEGDLSGVPGLDEARIASLKGALAVLRAGRTRIPLGRAHQLTSALQAEFERGSDQVVTFPVGSLRRSESSVGDLELIAVAADPRAAVERFTSLPSVSAVLHRSTSKAAIRIDKTQITLRVVTRESLGTALVHHTGSRDHVRRLKGLAAGHGLRLTDHALYRHGGDETLPCPEEEDVYRALGLPFIAPELRQDRGEIEAALTGRLPALVATTDIRGDLHMHSAWSDGRDSVEAMAAACREIGYEYIAITDHSQSAGSGRKLSVDDVGRQRAEIEAIRRQHPDMPILHGVELEILPDGSLDFDDRLLAGFDVVLASLHDDAGQDGATLTARYERVLRHPLVHIITHPANRRPGQDDGYPLDWDRLFRVAAETGTILEVDGAPGHLDLDGTLARRAVAAGVLLSIDSDCHRAEWLARQMRFGVATARRGWVEPAHVLNTRTWPEVKARLARKRSRA